MNNRPVTIEERDTYLASLPLDEEPLTPEEQAALAQRLRDIADRDA